MAWLVHFLGLDFGSAYGHYVPYDLWSGLGSDIGEYTVAGALAGHGAAYYGKHRCHAEREPGKKCRRIGRHAVDGSPYCDRHHQDARGSVAAARTRGNR